MTLYRISSTFVSEWEEENKQSVKSAIFALIASEPIESFKVPFLRLLYASGRASCVYSGGTEASSIMASSQKRFMTGTERQGMGKDCRLIRMEETQV